MIVSTIFLATCAGAYSLINDSTNDEKSCAYEFVSTPDVEGVTYSSPEDIAFCEDNVADLYGTLAGGTLTFPEDITAHHAASTLNAHTFAQHTEQAR